MPTQEVERVGVHTSAIHMEGGYFCNINCLLLLLRKQKSVPYSSLLKEGYKLQLLTKLVILPLVIYLFSNALGCFIWRQHTYPLVPCARAPTHTHTLRYTFFQVFA
ncbi:hypothetical protein GOP47_0001266 [Adiantum capillus-veneris]|uniref:Uncharacterized protein n=1 Tax=Adiantum capillus-veneris TaxID=13818 RepID=A0A9D4VF14_ADICA|nr:hypothetical protein GOP47_0001266 [Adiantum capillus-veneris]